MKKSISAVLTAVLILCGFTYQAFAAAPSEDGIYEVAIELRHAEKDKTSMGNRYIVPTACLEIINGEKYLTMAANSEIANLQFWYYNDGSTEGDSTEAEQVRDVVIGGKTYAIGFRFPLVGEGQNVGVRFKAPIMPVTPSARVQIDYDSAVMPAAVTTQAPETTTQTTTTAAPTTVTQTTETTTAPETTTEMTTVPETTEELTEEETTAPVTEPESMPTPAEEKSGGFKIWMVLVPAAVLIIIAVFVVVVIKKKR